jgi:hypothetical protein
VCGFPMVTFAGPNFIGLKLMALAKKKSKSKERPGEKAFSSRPRRRFAICVKGTGFDTMIGRAYQILEDRKASKMGCVRVIDASGEDYLYPSSWFVRIRVDSGSERRVATALKSSSPAA